jgi:hypothetical protein
VIDSRFLLDASTIVIAGLDGAIHSEAFADQ